MDGDEDWLIRGVDRELAGANLDFDAASFDVSYFQYFLIFYRLFRTRNGSKEIPTAIPMDRCRRD